MVYVLGVAAAVLLAVGFVLQQHAAEQEPPSLRLSPHLLLDLLRRPLWLTGIASMVGGQVLGAVAFSFGAVALVEPLLAANLLFALPMVAVYHRRRLRGADFLGALVLVAGLAIFVVASQPDGGSPRAPGLAAWVVVFAALAVVVALLLVVQRGKGAVATAGLLATGAGLLFGMQDTLTQAADGLIARGLLALLVSWVPLRHPDHRGVRSPALTECVRGGTAVGIVARDHRDRAAAGYHFGDRAVRRTRANQPARPRRGGARARCRRRRHHHSRALAAGHR